VWLAPQQGMRLDSGGSGIIRFLCRQAGWENARVRRTIPFFNYPALFASSEDTYLDTIRRVLAAGKYILQEDLERFERNLAAWLGVGHVIGVGSGTDALLLALRAAGVKPGDEVIMPSHTFVATGSAVHYAGAVPVLVDVRDDHLIDPAAVRRAVTPRTRAVVPVQLNGRTGEMDTLQEIAVENGLVIIEDAAQALGSQYDGRKAGTFGVAAGFSFYPAKLLGCFGDGGAVATDNDTVAERVRRLRDHGRAQDYGVREWSYNSRLDNLQAAILDQKLAILDDALSRRRAIAALYHERLSRLPGLLLPPPPGTGGRHFDVFQNYEIEAERRDELRNFLAENGVGTIIQWGGRAIHQFPALGFEVDLPVTDRIMAASLLLPMNTALTDEDVLYICDLFDTFYGD